MQRRTTTILVLVLLFFIIVDFGLDIEETVNSGAFVAMLVWRLITASGRVPVRRRYLCPFLSTLGAFLFIIVLIVLVLFVFLVILLFVLFVLMARALLSSYGGLDSKAQSKY